MSAALLRRLHSLVLPRVLVVLDVIRVLLSGLAKSSKAAAALCETRKDFLEASLPRLQGVALDDMAYRRRADRLLAVLSLEREVLRVEKV